MSGRHRALGVAPNAYLCALSANTTDDGVWVDAANLTAGEHMLSLDGDYGVVESVVIVDEMQTMYDLDVETVDTFAVGDGAWVVHNCDYVSTVLGYSRG